MGPDRTENTKKFNPWGSDNTIAVRQELRQTGHRLTLHSVVGDLLLCQRGCAGTLFHAS